MCVCVYMRMCSFYMHNVFSGYLIMYHWNALLKIRNVHPQVLQRVVETMPATVVHPHVFSTDTVVLWIQGAAASGQGVCAFCEVTIPPPGFLPVRASYGIRFILGGKRPAVVLGEVIWENSASFIIANIECVVTLFWKHFEIPILDCLRHIVPVLQGHHEAVESST